eukprot:Gb_38939 [translate_table: standard]
MQAMRQRTTTLGCRGALILSHGPHPAFNRLFMSSYQTAECEKLPKSCSVKDGLTDQSSGISSSDISKYSAQFAELDFPNFTQHAWQICCQSSMRTRMKYCWQGPSGTRNLRNHFGPISVDERTSNVSLEGGRYDSPRMELVTSCHAAVFAARLKLLRNRNTE